MRSKTVCDYPLFYGTAPHAAPPFPLPYGGGALLREPSRPPNDRFRIDIRAAREYDSLLAPPRPKKREKKSSLFTPSAVPNAGQSTTFCTMPPAPTAGCHLVGTIVGYKKVLVGWVPPPATVPPLQSPYFSNRKSPKLADPFASFLEVLFPLLFSFFLYHPMQIRN